MDNRNEKEPIYSWNSFRGVFVDKLKKGGKILDIGAGPGAVDSADFRDRGFDVVTSDMEIGILDTATKINQRKLRPVGAKLSHLPFPAGSFDGVWAANVLIFEDVGVALKELSRILQKDGKLFICDNHLGKDHTDRVRELAKNAGLRIISSGVNVDLPEKSNYTAGGMGFDIYFFERTL